jgi:hypothetical protein
MVRLGSALSLVKGKGQKCAVAGIVDALFGVQALSRHTLAFASPRTFGGKAETDVHDESVIEVGSPNCVVKIPRSRLAERD